MSFYLKVSVSPRLVSVVCMIVTKCCFDGGKVATPDGYEPVGEECSFWR